MRLTLNLRFHTRQSLSKMTTNVQFQKTSGKNKCQHTQGDIKISTRSENKKIDNKHGRQQNDNMLLRTYTIILW